MDTTNIPIALAYIRSWTRLIDDDDDDQLKAILEAAFCYACAYTGRNLSADMPHPVKQAICVMVADWYTNREGQVVGTAHAHALMNSFRVVAL